MRLICLCIRELQCDEPGDAGCLYKTSSPLYQYKHSSSMNSHAKRQFRTRLLRRISLERAIDAPADVGACQQCGEAGRPVDSAGDAVIGFDLGGPPELASGKGLDAERRRARSHAERGNEVLVGVRSLNSSPLA